MSQSAVIRRGMWRAAVKANQFCDMPVNLSRAAAPVCANDLSSATHAAGKRPAAPQFLSSLGHYRSLHHQHLLPSPTRSGGLAAGTAPGGGAPWWRWTLTGSFKGFVRRSLFFFFLPAILLSRGHFIRYTLPSGMQGAGRRIWLAFGEVILTYLSSCWRPVVSNQSIHSDLWPLWYCCLISVDGFSLLEHNWLISLGINKRLLSLFVVHSAIVEILNINQTHV